MARVRWRSPWLLAGALLLTGGCRREPRPLEAGWSDAQSLPAEAPAAELSVTPPDSGAASEVTDAESAVRQLIAGAPLKVTLSATSAAFAPRSSESSAPSKARDASADAPSPRPASPRVRTPRASTPRAVTPRLVAASTAPAPAPAPLSRAKAESAASGHRVPVPVPPPADVQASLLRLRSLQANLYAIGGGYSPVPDELGFLPDPGVDVEVVWASSSGWAAVARDLDRDEIACTMYVGNIPHEGAAAGRIDDASAGVPYCAPSNETPGHWVAYPPPLHAATGAGLAWATVTLMRSDLRKLALSQRANRRAEGVYARHIDPMSLHYAWHPGVTLRILAADAQGWSAEATYDRWPGKSCVIWGGVIAQKPVTAGAGKIADGEGVPVCDE